mgnify:CR=1 FL=1
MAEHAVVSQLIEELRAQGRVVAMDEHFDLDREHAREKMQRFRLEDPRHYVLEWVQAAHLLGATRLLIHYNARVFSLRFDGEQLDSTDLTGLYAAAFAPRTTRRERALRYLALGIGASQGLEPRLISIESASARRGGVKLSIRRGREDTVTAYEDATFNGTRIELVERMQVSHVLKFFKKHAEETYESGLLQTRCFFAEMPITLNGERISQGADPGSDFPIRLVIDEPHEKGMLGLSTAPGESKVSILQHGVLVAEHTLDTPYYSVRVIVDSDRLTRNLTSSAFVEDEIWREFQDEIITQQIHRALRRLVEPLMEDDHLRTAEEVDTGLLEWMPYLEAVTFPWLVDVAREVYKSCGDMRARGRALPAHTRELALLFERFPMWPAGDMVEGLEPWQTAMVSLRTLGVGLEQPGVLMYTHDRIRQIRFDRMRGQVLWHRPYDRHKPLEIIERYLQARGEDVTVAMQKKWRRARNILIWQKRGIFSGFDPTRYPVSVSRRLIPPEDDRVPVRERFEDERPSLQVALFDGSKNSDWDIVKEGRLLRAHRMDDAPLKNLRIVWRGDFATNDVFDDIERDAMGVRLALETCELIGELVVEYANAIHQRDYRSNQAFLLDFLDVQLEGSLVRGLLRSMGYWREEFAPIIEEWFQAKSRSIRSFQWLTALADRQAREDVELDYLASLLGDLTKIPLFEGLDGELASLEQILADVSNVGRLAIIPHEGAFEARRHGRSVKLERLVIVTTPQTERILRALLSSRKLQVFDYELAMLAGRDRFLRKPVEDIFISEPSLHVIELRGDHFHGVLGLLPHVTPPPGRVRLRLLHMQRPLLELERVVPLGQFLAVVDADAIQPTSDWKGAREDAVFDDLVSRVERATREALHSWLDQLASAPERLLEQPLEWLLCMRLVDMLLSEEVVDVTRQNREARRAREAAVFKVASGGGISFEQYSNRIRTSEDLFFCMHPVPEDLEEHLAEHHIPASEVLVVPQNIARVGEWLGQLFPGKHRIIEARDFGALRARLEAARDAFMARPLQELDLEGEPLSKRRIADELTRGVVGVMLDASSHLATGRARLTLLHRSRLVTTLEINIPLGRAEARFDVDHLIDWERSDAVSVHVRHELERRTERVVLELLLELIEAATQDPGGLDDEVRDMLRAYLWRLRKDPPRALGKVREALGQAPLYQRADALWLNEEQIIFEAAGESGSLHAIFLGEEDLLPLSPEDPRMRTGAPITFASFHERDLFASTFPDIDLMGSVPERPEEDAPDGGASSSREEAEGDDENAMVAPASITRAGEITEQLSALLVEMCGEHHAWLETTLMHGLSVEALASRHLVASASSDLVLVDAEHPATHYALESEGDPVALAMLTSCVYSAINLFWEEVTDRDEIEAQAWLSRTLLEDLERSERR